MSTPRLPELILLEHYEGNYQAYEEAIYAIFRADFITTVQRLEGKPIRFREEPRYKNKEECFWHIVSEGTGDDRNIELNRCSKIGWVKALILSHGSDEIYYWENVRPTRSGPSTRSIISLKDFSYIVVLEKRKWTWHLITAYPVRHRNKEKLKGEYENWKKELGTEDRS